MMLRIPTSSHSRDNGYPTTDRRIMPGTEWHRTLMFLLIDMLGEHFLAQSRVCVSGDVLVFYEKGDKQAAKKELQAALADHPSSQEEQRIKELLSRMS